MIYSYSVFWASPKPLGITFLALVLGTSIMGPNWEFKKSIPIMAFRYEGEAHREFNGSLVLIAGGFNFGRGPGFKVPSRPILNPNGISKCN